MTRKTLIVAAVVVGATCGLACVPWAVAADANTAAAAAEPMQLPQTQEYQRILRKHLATLVEKDFDTGVTAEMGTPEDGADPERQYRNFLYTQSPHPLVGSKRGSPAITSPSMNYTLARIETPKGVCGPAGWAEATISLVQWDYPGNVYRDNRGLKMRCYVGSAINLIMIDDLVGKNEAYGRTDRVSYWLIRTGAAYPVFKSLLPAEVQKAYQDGVRRVAERLLATEPRGEEAQLDMMAPVGLSYAARVLEDPEFTGKVEAYAKKMFTDPKYFSPAGYWVERGGLDVNYAGTQNYFAIWAALMNDWPFANETLGKVYRLRAHLMLPEPTGKFTGPSAFNTRTGGAVIGDQWNYENRDRGALMITDECAFLESVPTNEQLAGGGANRSGEYNRQISENPRNEKGEYLKSEDLHNTLWGYSILPNYNFPASVNPAFEFYKKGSLAHLKSLVEKNSPMLKSPYLRGENFVRDFDKVFVTTRQPTFAAIVHAGPVASQKAGELPYQFGAPLGYGGGQLSAFWTPATGSVILARRSGQYWQKPFEDLKAFQNMPIHAVSGTTADGITFTSARIAKPEKVSVEASDSGATIDFSGPLVAFSFVKDPEEADKSKARDIYYDAKLASPVAYRREIRTNATGATVQTTLTGDDKLQVNELYETIPVLILDPATLDPKQPTITANTKIEFQAGGKWADATDAYADGVSAVKITRYTGAVTVTFDKPRRVKLSPKEFADAYVSRTTSRNVVVDLLETGDKPGAVNGEKKISYRIESAK